MYTQATNRRHGRSGHLFRGRFKGILVDGDSYLLELTRYVVFKPVRAGMVEQPERWQRSSYQAMTGQVPTPMWLSTDTLLSQFGRRRNQARKRYRDFVLDGIDKAGPWTDLNQQVYLGDTQFVERMQDKMRIRGDKPSIPKRQRRAPARPLAEIAEANPHRNDAIVAAYATGAYSYQEIATYHGLHLPTVGRIVRQRWMQR